MNSSNQSILITGANGFVGSRLCRQFLDNGFRVVAGVRKTSDLTLLGGLNLEFRYGDVTQPDSLPEMVKDVDFVIHNAGLLKSKKKQSFFFVNEKGTNNLFTAIAEHNPGVKKVIFISSAAASGPSKNGRAVTEQDTPHPITTYGHSKLAGEKVALSFKDKFNVAIIRPPGVYGPGDKEILPFFESVHKGIRPMIGNTSRKLQLVEVDDLCQAIYKTIVSETASGAIFFAAEHQAYTMKELINILSVVCGKDGFNLYIPSFLLYIMAFITQGAAALVGASPMLTKEKAGELLASWEMSTERAQKELGFISRIPFPEGARITYDWYLKHGWIK